MNFSTALPTFVITLREGVEAALVVGIVLALLKKAKQSRLNSWVYAGVGVGIIVSALIGVLFSVLIQALGKINPQYTSVVEPTLEGVFSVLAIAMLSWMLIWMTKQARFMKAQVEGAVTEALTQKANAGWGVFSLILVAVVREGFETVLFIAANFQQGLIPTIGALGGLLVAAGIGVLLFKLGVKINIRQFFQVMGVLLVLIVAGLVVSALKHFDEAVANLALSSRATENLCFYYEHFTKIHSCILGPMVWNTSNILPDEQFPGIILKSLFGYRQHLYVVEAVGYIVFLLTVGGLYFRSLNGGVSTAAKNVSLAGK
ncbi:FTR1 family iron permease [Nostoc sp. FACHB-152]|uniref:FTR1 family iron permease n=1 Tax=unclassified Nostoc TaxID=2593658 RepID=UPI001682424C|nr:MULTISPECIES: FTR1 family protein [unclassified Nostoc]MBD2447629.1 FTR1 family iron permease [Nostoc sp. FACHB-152]MBD2470620.1 FTR1 family iron permease [Nostoc sp. FACHB-145]